MFWAFRDIDTVVPLCYVKTGSDMLDGLSCNNWLKKNDCISGSDSNASEFLVQFQDYISNTLKCLGDTAPVCSVAVCEV